MIARAQYAAAHHLLQSVLDVSSSLPGVSLLLSSLSGSGSGGGGGSSSSPSASSSVIGPDDPLYGTLLNNYALCALYSNNIQFSVLTMENLLKRDPRHAVHEAIITNLCTLYGLASSRPESKKKVLQKIVLEYGPDDFDLSLFQAD